MDIIMSLAGIAVLIGLALLMCDNRRAIRLRTVFGAFVLQLSLGGFILYVPWGRELLAGFSSGIHHVIDYGKEGMIFLFGSLVDFSVKGIGFIFAFQVLPSVVFFSALISVLYHVGLMQWVIKIIGGSLQKALGTSRAESMSAAANIFVGQTEAPLVVRPFVARMTNSELFAIMCGGLASIAGSLLSGYASMGIPLEYLVAASFMAAPGGLLFAKLIKPECETETPNAKDSDGTQVDEEQQPANAIEAAALGASVGMKLSLNIGAMLLAFIGLVALLNGVLGGAGSWFGYEGLSFDVVLGWIFSPLSYVIGVPWEEATTAGSLLGQKVVMNEFVAYSNFVPFIGDHPQQLIAATGQVMSEKTQAIIAFSLCGFANISSLAILLGGLGSMAPSRRKDIARMGIKAVMAGTLSNLMSATIAGLFLSL